MSSLIGILGQINLSTPLGKKIYDLVFLNKFENIVDIGTWNGLGTTLCILKALEDKADIDTKLFTIELYKDVFEAAKINLSNYRFRDNFIMLNGTIIQPNDINWFDHSTIDFEKDLHAKLWYKKDIENLNKAQNILNMLPSKIDLLILDGGEYTTYPEWNYLKNRTKYFVLDDTAILKCSKIRQEILNDSNCTILDDNLNERNGYLIGYFNDR